MIALNMRSTEMVKWPQHDIDAITMIALMKMRSTVEKAEAIN